MSALVRNGVALLSMNTASHSRRARRARSSRDGTGSLNPGVSTTDIPLRFSRGSVIETLLVNGMYLPLEPT